MRQIIFCCAFAILTLAIPARAITTGEFDKLDCNYRGQYLSALVYGSMTGLQEHGDASGSTKLGHLYADQTSAGFFAQFEYRLMYIKELNKENAAHPDNKEPVYQVEHAFARAAKDNDISIPVDFLMTLGAKFKPTPVQRSPLIDPINQPAWAPGVKEDYKEAYRQLVITSENAAKGYDDGICNLREESMGLEAAANMVESEAIPLSGNRHAYVSKDGNLVDDNGIPLKGEDLLDASQKKNGPIGKYAVMKEFRDTANEKLALIKNAQELKAKIRKTLEENGPASVTQSR